MPTVQTLSRTTLVALWLLGCGALLGCGSRTGLSEAEADTRAPDAGRRTRDAGRLPPQPACVEFGDALELVTVTPSGEPSVGGAGSPTLSATGERVAFVTSAADLGPGDTNEELDVYVRDRAARTTARASVTSDGAEGDDASGFRLISGRPTLSADGDLVAFPSNSDRLHPEDDNGRTDVYVHSFSSGETRFVEVGDPRFEGGDAPALAADGRSIVFAAFYWGWRADDGIAAFQPARVDLTTGETVFAARDAGGALMDERDDSLSGVTLTRRVLDVSADGRHVAFASASENLDEAPNGRADIFVADLETGALDAITADADDRSFGPAISADGRFVGFTSQATNYTDIETTVYVRDRETRALDPIPDAYGFPGLSGDGRFVAFVRDRVAHVFDRATRAEAALTGPIAADDETQDGVVISADGCWVTFLWSVGPVSQVWVARNPLR